MKFCDSPSEERVAIILDMTSNICGNWKKEVAHRCFILSPVLVSYRVVTKTLQKCIYSGGEKKSRCLSLALKALQNLGFYL